MLCRTGDPRFSFSINAFLPEFANLFQAAFDGADEDAGQAIAFPRIKQGFVSLIPRKLSGDTVAVSSCGMA
ncbi:hypothetical protein GC176_02730 [bacterium]|nr:hypothetical protein [bacterium]